MTQVTRIFLHVHLCIVNNYFFVLSVTHIEQTGLRLLTQIALATGPLHDNSALDIILCFFLFILFFVFLSLTVIVDDDLRNEHKVFKHILIEFLGEATDDGLGVFTVDGHSKTKFDNDHETLDVYESGLVDGPNRSLLDVCPHRNKLIVKVDER